jgi:peptidoglycan/LPS O-acetylase OafA/YrhL
MTEVEILSQIRGHSDTSRRYDIDWLRVLGMLTVFLFHCGRFFDTDGWHVKSQRMSPALDIVNTFVVQWMMPLFFILSGMSIYYSLGRQRWSEFLVSRLKRLVVPLLFGTFVIIAPWQVYLERVSHGQYSGSFWRWYWHDYFSGWYGLGGNFAWMGIHLWYLEVLLCFSVIALPLFLYLQSPSGQRAVGALSRLLKRPGAIFLPALVIGAAEFIASIPVINNSIFGNEGFGGWSFLPYFVMLILGYLLAGGPGLTGAMERHCLPAMAAGIITFVLGYLAYKATEPWAWLPRELVMSFVRGILCWAWLMAICGFASRHLRFSNRFLKYANEAVLPFYILHQTVILTIGFYVIRLDTSLWLEYLIITFSAFAVTVTVYELLIKRFNALRFLFGMKLLRRRQPVRVVEGVAAS